jgi:hypothetical protein
LSGSAAASINPAYINMMQRGTVLIRKEGYRTMICIIMHRMGLKKGGAQVKKPLRGLSPR